MNKKPLEKMSKEELNERLDSIIGELGYKTRKDFYKALEEKMICNPAWDTARALRYVLDEK